MGTDSGNVTRTAQAMSKNGSLDSWECCTRDDLVVGDVVFRLLEPFLTIDVSTIQSPGLANIQKGGQDHGPKDCDFGIYDDSVIAEDPM